MPTSNLERSRPDAWQHGLLFPFIEDCWNNTLATVAKKSLIASRLTAVDAIFDELHSNLKVGKIDQLIPALLVFRSFSAFRASVMVAMAMPTDSFALTRSTLESAGYAMLISNTPGLAELWLKRDDDKKARQRFTQASVRDAIASADKSLSTVYQTLYDTAIDFGAHPNEKSVLMNLRKETIRTPSIQFRMLPGDEGPLLSSALKHCGQVGVCAVKIFSLIFKTQTDGIWKKIEKASVGFW
jgi:hypothetical protein